jgi:hypothetical protein
LAAPAGGRETRHQIATIAVLVITYLSLVIGELIPKRLALHSPKRIPSRGILHAKEFLTDRRTSKFALSCANQWSFQNKPLLSKCWKSFARPLPILLLSSMNRVFWLGQLNILEFLVGELPDLARAATRRVLAH